MEVIVKNHTVRIKGDICGKDRYIKIYCAELNGEDHYSISVIKDGMEIGCGEAFYMNKNKVIQRRNGEQKII